MIETEVLVVGAGPAGLVAAITLAHYGVDVLLVEKRRHLDALPHPGHQHEMNGADAGMGPRPSVLIKW